MQVLQQHDGELNFFNERWDVQDMSYFCNIFESDDLWQGDRVGRVSFCSTKMGPVEMAVFAQMLPRCDWLTSLTICKQSTTTFTDDAVGLLAVGLRSSSCRLQQLTLIAPTVRGDHGVARLIDVVTDKPTFQSFTVGCHDISDVALLALVRLLESHGLLASLGMHLNEFNPLCISQLRNSLRLNGSLHDVELMLGRTYIYKASSGGNVMKRSDRCRFRALMGLPSPVEAPNTESRLYRPRSAFSTRSSWRLLGEGACVSRFTFVCHNVQHSCGLLCTCGSVVAQVLRVPCLKQWSMVSLVASKNSIPR
jgi:hypothetical protein